MNGLIDKGALIRAMQERKTQGLANDSGWNELNHWLRELRQGSYDLERYV